MGHIFISYSHKDTQYTHRFTDKLQDMGFELLDPMQWYMDQLPRDKE